nr:hypothetical protein [Tanacetum cinerariifolium]
MHDEGFKVVTTAKMIIDTVIDAAQVTTDVADIPISATDTMVTTTPIIKATKTIVKQKELTDDEKAKLFMELLEKRIKFFAAKRAESKRNKPPTKA